MKTRTIHNFFRIERMGFRVYPAWLTKFLEQVQQSTPTSKPLALLLSEEQNASDSFVLMRLADLLALLRAEE
jgi:hypothetical protein